MKRECGGCTLCCRLIPVPPMDKKAGERCRHQRLTGCQIYARRPMECRMWHCKWLINDDAADLSRPDRAGYVIDMMPDYISAVPPGGERINVPVVQIWCDPKRPDAHRDPALRRWLMRRGEQGIAAIIRYGANAGFVLVPPNMSQTKDWLELGTNVDAEAEHKLEDILEVMEGKR